MPVSGWLAELWDRIVASDPGLTRLRVAGAAAVSMASALAVEYGFATATHAGPTGTVIAMLLGAVMAMMGSTALSGPAVWPKVRTAVFFPIAIGSGMLAGVAVGDHTDLMLAVFVLVMFTAVAVRRFGIPFFFYGFMGWMGYFFASFLHATLAMLPGLIAATAVATVWILLLSVTVLRTSTTRTLHRTVAAFGARARAVARACADLLADAGNDPRQRDRLQRRVHSRQTRLAEAALMVEAWSAEEGALLPEQPAATLRRRLIDAQQVLDRMVAASVTLADGDPALARAAARAADRLARRDDLGANREAHALAEAAEQSAQAPIPDRLTGWLAARHFAVAALEFVKLVREANARDLRDPDGGEPVDEFEAVVALAMGNLPGSPMVAQDVPPRGRWNPLARLDLTTRQAVQVSVAGAMAILIGRELSPVRYYWAAIAAFVMFTGTATRAETFLKGFNRVVGTLVGLVASVWLAELTAGNTAAVLVVIVASMFLGFYLLGFSYAYMIFFVTIMVGQLYSALHEFSSGLLVLRLEETAIGAAVGIVVAFTITPLSTRDTVRTARDNLLTTLADLLGAAADRLAGTRSDRPAGAGPAEDSPAEDRDGAVPEEHEQDLDALTRTLDDRLRQLTMVAKPLTRPLLWGNSPRHTRYRLALYAATTTHARTLAVALRHQPGRPDRQAAELATACRALATAATRLTEAAPGRPQPAVAEPLAQADTVLFSHAPAAPGVRATDPVIVALIHLQDLLHNLAAVPRADLEAAEEGTGMVGTITDDSGEPIHARVALIADTSTEIAAAYSDAAGRYHIDHCPPGRYLAVATATCHTPSETRVVLRATGPTRADFTVAGAARRAGIGGTGGTARGRAAPLVGSTIILPDRTGDVVATRCDQQ